MQQELQNLQKLVQEIYENIKNQQNDKQIDIQDIFYINIHQQFWLNFLNKPYFIKYFEVQKPWTIYWNLNALSCLKQLHLLSKEQKKILSQFLILCQKKEGGFSGSQQNQSHLLSSYAAILALAILDDKESWDQIDIQQIENFLLQVKNENGSFNCNVQGEMDLRATYCALVIAKLLNLKNDKIFENVFEFIQSCQTYEGGIGPKPFDEAHGGFTFCGVASLSILNKLNDIDLQKLIQWLVNQQDSYYGGFKGRTNKLVDSCYSFWQASSFNIIAEYDNKFRINQELLYNQGMMQKYLLYCCQDIDKGGFIDKPGKNVDYYHSNYAMMGLALSCNNQNDIYRQNNNKNFNWNDLQLEDIDPVFAIPRKSKLKFQEYFQNKNQ